MKRGARRRACDLSEDVQRRFWLKVDKRGNGHWLWRATTQGDGYVIFRGGIGRDARGSRPWVTAHVYSYAIANGGNPTDVGVDIDHLCRRKACVNPAHLEAVTHRENTQRGISPAARQARMHLCPLGHEFSIEKSGKRRCLICRHEYEKRRYVKRYGREPKPQKNPRRAA